ncbi:hypothetical protein HPB48_002777 [Haemaphysalis longicornis]|uniref:Transposable element P transposase-like RNase H domain-containing protein n=1 Tax=Haemaphysalis longicornis TaxID=44386 RepID=A0A9J6GRG9_HAELO|nr:hypothetical protein HPB48_002777 [Haemaphysalis longicornis]
MVGVIHSQPLFVYKGGNSSGEAANSHVAATSAHVFMLQSTVSSFLEVVLVLPVRAMNAESLHKVLKEVILGLEKIGFRVPAVVPHNNSINRKAFRMFLSPSKLRIAYPSPADASRPLFHIADAVHLMKCVRNNWFNQKENPGTNLYFPLFDLSKNTVHHECIQSASFNELCDLHKLEASQLLKYSYHLSSKALNPRNLERQNVKLALQLLNEFMMMLCIPTVICHHFHMLRRLQILSQ